MKVRKFEWNSGRRNGRKTFVPNAINTFIMVRRSEEKSIWNCGVLKECDILDKILR